MNYLTEILAFYAWLRDHPLDGLTQSFWHYLMQTNNRLAIKTEGGGYFWPVAFRLANTEVIGALGLKDRNHVWRLRRHLIASGRVRYDVGARGSAGTYGLIPFDYTLSEVTVARADTGLPVRVWSPADPMDAPVGHPFINNKYINSNTLYDTANAAEHVPAGFTTPMDPEAIRHLEGAARMRALADYLFNKQGD